MQKVIKIPEYKDVKEVTFSYWCVSLGEEVKQDHILAVVETSEGYLELEAGIAGEVLALLVKEGDKLSVDDEIAMIGIDIERINKTLSSIGITDKASIVNEVLPKRLSIDPHLRQDPEILISLRILKLNRFSF